MNEEIASRLPGRTRRDDCDGRTATQTCPAIPCQNQDYVAARTIFFIDLMNEIDRINQFDRLIGVR
ncbi:MAG: hypothetical protein AB7O80_14035 [Acetobacteraceae bacterium]